MKKIKTVILASALAFSGITQAAFLIEPHVGYQFAGSGDHSLSGTKFEYDYSGAQLGLKTGVQYLGLMAGVDYTFSSPEIETKASGATFKDSFSKKELGVFVGYNLPILLRAWVGYYFDVKARDKDDVGFFGKGDEFSGSATELGVGFTALPFLSVNLMYRMVKFDEFKQDGVKAKLTGAEELSTSEIVLGVSLPLTF